MISAAAALVLEFAKKLLQNPAVLFALMIPVASALGYFWGKNDCQDAQRIANLQKSLELSRLSTSKAEEAAGRLSIQKGKAEKVLESIAKMDSCTLTEEQVQALDQIQ